MYEFEGSSGVRHCRAVYNTLGSQTINHSIFRRQFGGEEFNFAISGFSAFYLECAHAHIVLVNAVCCQMRLH